MSDMTEFLEWEAETEMNLPNCSSRAASAILKAAGYIKELEADKERLLAEVARHWHCTCLPYAEPDDGECGRCRFLRLGGTDE
ncbi:MAG: hypothetical protein ACWGQW_15540 [bacterium]